MKANRIVVGVALGSAAVLALSTMFGSFYTVDQGDRAVLLRNGVSPSTIVKVRGSSPFPLERDCRQTR